MTADIVIRRAHAGDAAIVAEYNAAIARETEGRELPAEVVAAGVRQALGDEDRGVYYLAEIAGRVVGQMLITREWSDWRNGWFWWIQSVYVTAEQRRRGVFRVLHGHVRNLARRDPGVCGLRLYVDRHNTRAIQTYQALGMIDSGYVLLEEDWSADAAG